MSNLRSVAKAFEAIGCRARVCDEPGGLAGAERLVLPGNGAFRAGMERLRARRLIEPLREAVLDRQTPVLGICLGMQLLAAVGWEHGRCDGLGWIQAEVQPLDTGASALKLPHIGWNEVEPRPGSRLLADLPVAPVFYFVHGFHVVCSDGSLVKGTCRYGAPFASVIEVGNVYATQFHPEKSQRAGLAVLRNFVKATS